MKDKMFSLYQLSKLNGVLWWTGTLRITKNELLQYKNDDNYVYTTNKNKARELSGKSINH